MSIKRKLTLMMMGISLSAVLLTVSAITAYLIYDMNKSKTQDLQVMATMAGDHNSAAIMFADKERIDKNLEIFRLNPSVLATCIYDAKGTLFASYKNNEQGTISCPHKNTTLVYDNGADVRTTLQMIYHNKDVVGSIFIATDTRDINAYIHKIMLISITAVILVLAVTLLLTMYFQRVISAPILELAATVLSITAKRDYSLEAKVAYDDETALLARALNNMLGEVRKRDSELVLANETLEQKVLRRTQQLEEAKHKAEIANEAKSEFLRNMSHEFRTPLHAMVSFSAYGINESETASRNQLKHYFEFIQKGSDRLTRLVGQILDLGRMEHGEYELMLENCNVSILLRHCVDMMQPLLKEKAIKLYYNPDGQPLITSCDPDKIIQVITNILANAVKFTPSGNGVSISAISDGALVSVTIVDEGVGIPKGEEELIFESFHQSSRTKTGAGGTGLGLTICRNIVKAHGGKIWAENNKNGLGARVTFTLPVTPAKDKDASNTTMRRSYGIAA